MSWVDDPHAANPLISLKPPATLPKWWPLMVQWQAFLTRKQAGAELRAQYSLNSFGQVRIQVLLKSARMSLSKDLLEKILFGQGKSLIPHSKNPFYLNQQLIALLNFA